MKCGSKVLESDKKLDYPRVALRQMRKYAKAHSIEFHMETLLSLKTSSLNSY